MLRDLRSAILLFVVLMALTGAAYPAAITLVAQALFPHEAHGSIVQRNGTAIGSELVGQPFSGARYFWPRPSATSPAYNGAASTGSNLAPTNPALIDAVAQRAAALRAAHPAAEGDPPIDLVTASGSGLDPHISPAAANYQLARVAAARGLPEERVREVVLRCTAGRTFGLLGEPRVNVWQLNSMLDSLTDETAGD